LRISIHSRGVKQAAKIDQHNAHPAPVFKPFFAYLQGKMVKNPDQ